MGRRGPKPTPTKVLEQRGSWRVKLRVGDVNPLGELTKPTWVRGRAARVWEKVAGELKAAGLGTRIDSMALGRYCIYMAILAKLLRKIEADDGLLVSEFVSEDGDLHRKPSPEMANIKNIETMCAKLEASFGITPAARAGLKAERAPGQADKKTEWFGKNKKIG